MYYLTSKSSLIWNVNIVTQFLYVKRLSESIIIRNKFVQSSGLVLNFSLHHHIGSGFGLWNWLLSIIYIDDDKDYLDFNIIDLELTQKWPGSEHDNIFCGTQIIIIMIIIIIQPDTRDVLLFILIENKVGTLMGKDVFNEDL